MELKDPDRANLLEPAVGLGGVLGTEEDDKLAAREMLELELVLIIGGLPDAPDWLRRTPSLSPATVAFNVGGLTGVLSRVVWRGMPLLFG